MMENLKLMVALAEKVLYVLAVERLLIFLIYVKKVKKGTLE